MLPSHLNRTLQFATQCSLSCLSLISLTLSQSRTLSLGSSIHRSPRFPISAKDMASEDFSSLSAADDEKFGFQRPEMYKSNLASTVDPYDRHVFLCYKSPEAWAPKVEDSEADPLPKVLSSAVKARKSDILVKTKITICEGGNGSNFSDGDVLIFPDMIEYRGLKESDVDSFVDDVLVNGKPWASGVREVLTGSHVFVCSHGSRDRRCGVCGPVLIEKLKEEIELRDLKGQVFVSPCSHVGGHKYAGNLIIYSPGQDGNIMGHWYGYVTPDDVPELLDQHIGKGEIIERLWRGQMGVYAEEGEKKKEHKVPKGEDVKKREETSQETQNVGGCCQGANGISCCRDVGSEKANGELKETPEVQEKKGLCKLSCSVGKWEQRDVLTAVAIAGAVATVAVAYSFYRRSG